MALRHGPYPTRRIVVVPRDEVKHPNEVACDSRRLGGRQSQSSDAEVIPIMWSSAGPIDRVTQGHVVFGWELHTGAKQRQRVLFCRGSCLPGTPLMRQNPLRRWSPLIPHPWPLLEVFAGLPDVRSRRGIRHPLSSILALACCAMRCGARSYRAIAAWGRHYGAPIARALGFRHTPPVCGDTPPGFPAFGRREVRGAAGSVGRECRGEHVPGNR